MDYEYEYEDTGPRGGRILWGRVGILATALLLMFALGQCTAGSEPAADEVEDLRATVDRLEEENADLRSQLDALEAGSAEPEGEEDSEEGEQEEEQTSQASDTEQPDESADQEAAAAEADPPAEEEPRTHEVQQGEYLFTIAEEYYGDGAKFHLIVDANDISRDDPLRPGQTLTIPEE